MTGNYLLYLIKKSGSSGAEIGRRLGVCRATVNNVIHGKSSLFEVQEAIAITVGKPVKKIFPPSKIIKPKKNKQSKKEKQTHGITT